MKLNLEYGDRKLEFSLPENAKLIQPIEPKTNINYNSFSKYLKKQISLTISRTKKITSIAIVISDKSRLAEFHKYLTWIEKTIRDTISNKFQLIFFIAYGTHPRQSEEECLELYGTIYSKYQFIHHDPINRNFRSFGKTSYGTEVLINDLLFKSDLIITYGAISHHYFAGFGGGRKLIFPGLAAKKSILQNHSLFLDFNYADLNPGCKSGKLSGNPIAEDLQEIYSKLPPSIGIHAILNTKGKVLKVFIGDDYEIFERACKEYEKYYKHSLISKYDLVIASAGGFPKDINFIQSHKSLHNASEFVKDGGLLILLSECKDGIGNPALTKVFQKGSSGGIFQEMKKEYQNNGGTALSLLQKTKRIQVTMLTDLSEKECNKLNIQKISYDNIQSTINRNINNKIGVINNASMVYS